MFASLVQQDLVYALGRDTRILPEPANCRLRLPYGKGRNIIGDELSDVWEFYTGSCNSTDICEKAQHRKLVSHEDS